VNATNESWEKRSAAVRRKLIRVFNLEIIGESRVHHQENYLL
jgi:hypothetical protein